MAYSDAEITSFKYEIIDFISNGGLLMHWCRKEGKPGWNTVWKWIHDSEEFAGQMHAARCLQMQHWGEEIIEIADDNSKDRYIDDEGQEQWDTDHINRTRLRIDTRKFLMAKIAPKLFGDNIKVEHSGPDGGPIPIAAFIDRPPIESRAEWEARVKLRLLNGSAAHNTDAPEATAIDADYTDLGTTDGATVGRNRR